MSHPEQQRFVARTLARHSRFRDALGLRVLDVGSMDINGNNRGYFRDPRYIGIDVVDGRNVDLLCTAFELAWNGRMHGWFDVIISTECLEHDSQWELTLRAMQQLLNPGGLMVMTCAGPGRPEHGTNRSKPWDAPGLPWPDYYRNLSCDDIAGALDMSQFSDYELDKCDAPADSYFWGIKA